MIKVDELLERSAPLPPLSERKVVFISHANPEDNAITAWYGARLAAAGYEVWTDLTRLLGGEEMWRDIDNALRIHTRKVVVLLSRAVTSQHKEGVRAEIDRATFYRKKLDDRRFIIPVKIDDVPYEDLPPTISNRMLIDGYGSPAAALAEILTILNEDKVFRKESLSQDALLRWHKAFAPQCHEPEQAKDSILTNWYPVTSMPKEIHFYSIERPLENPFKEPAEIAKKHQLPMVAHERRLVTFANLHEVQNPIAEATPVKLDNSMLLDDFLSGGDSEISLGRGVPRKHISSLVRQAWDRFADDAGLKEFNLSEKTIAWYVPESVIGGDRVSFTRRSGIKGWRSLYGVYGPRNRNWHFGATCRLMMGDSLRLILMPHIVYTDPNGINSDTASYRRAHCKLWFNAKWRDLLYAYVAMLCDGEGQLKLPLSHGKNAIFSSSPISITLPFRPPRAVEQGSGSNSEDDGDAQDLDVSHLLDDPAFARSIEGYPEDESDEFNVANDDETEDEDRL